jgi:hypothetical protein
MRFGRGPEVLLAAGFLLSAMAASAAASEGPHGAATPALIEQVLFDFCQHSTCLDGQHPYASLIRERRG